MDISKTKYRIPQDIVHITQNVTRLKSPDEDASITLGREKKATTSGDGRRDLGGNVDWAEKRERNLIWYWVGGKD